MLCIQIARDKTIENKIDKAVTILNSPAFNPNLELFVYNNDSGVWFKILPNKEKIETSFCKFLNLELCSLLSTPE